MLTIFRYVLSPTHLHEFKSADRIETQSPVMSLFLQEQKLGSHSNTDSSSHKFMLKGRQTGGMHRGHGWVFRAESRETMLAWYEDIKNLTEKTGEERNAFVRKHARSFSAGSHKAGSISSEGALDEDEADHVPYSATTSQFEQEFPQEPTLLKRPQPGGRFPSDINVNRDLRVPLSPSSGASFDDHEILATNGPSLRPSSPTRQVNEQAMATKQNSDETTTNRVEDRDIVSGTTYNPPSADPSSLSSYQPQQNLHEGRWDSNIASTESGEIISASRDGSTSGIPLRPSSFRAQYGNEDRDEQERPHGYIRSMSDDPETVAAAMGLPGSNFPYVYTDDRPQLEGDSGQNDLARRDPKAVDYLRLDGNPDDTQNVSQLEPSFRQTTNFAANRDTVPSPAGQSTNVRVSSQAAVPTKGSEYYSQAVQAHGISSDAPGIVAYAEDPQTHVGQSVIPQETLDTHTETMERSGNETQENTTSADATELELNNNLLAKEGQATQPLLTTSPDDFEIGTALQQHREQRQIEQNQRTSNADSRPKTLPLEIDPLLSSAIGKDTGEAPVSTLVELGQFGSTPKQPESTSFETSFMSGSLASPIAPLSATIENSNGEETTSRPPLSSHVTISDLHIPGEFPYSPQAETAV